METCDVVLTFESVDEILDVTIHMRPFLAVVLHGAICFSIFYKIKFRIFLELILGTFRSYRVNMSDVPSHGFLCTSSLLF